MSDLSKLHILIKLKLQLYSDKNSYSRKLANEIYELENIVQNEMFFNKYKNIFVDDINFELPIGWYKQFQLSLIDINAFAKCHKIDFKISQVKEKFNGIRIQLDRTDMSDDVIPLLIRIESIIEPEFSCICMKCGYENNSKPLKNSLCDDHRK